MPLSQDEHDMLVEIRGSVKVLVENDKDKETRIRHLEKWKYLHLTSVFGSHGIVLWLKEFIK